MEKIKHILILLSLMLCFGNVNGQQNKEVNLYCVDYAGSQYGRDYAILLLKINSSTFFNNVGTVKIYNNDKRYIEIKSTFSSDSILIEGKGRLNRKTLEIKSLEKTFLGQSKYSYLCDIVSTEVMLNVELSLKEAKTKFEKRDKNKI